MKCSKQIALTLSAVILLVGVTGCEADQVKVFRSIKECSLTLSLESCKYLYDSTLQNYSEYAPRFDTELACLAAGNKNCVSYGTSTDKMWLPSLTGFTSNEEPVYDYYITDQGKRQIQPITQDLGEASNGNFAFFVMSTHSYAGPSTVVSGSSYRRTAPMIRSSSSYSSTSIGSSKSNASFVGARSTPSTIRGGFGGRVGGGS